MRVKQQYPVVSFVKAKEGPGYAPKVEWALSLLEDVLWKKGVGALAADGLDSVSAGGPAVFLDRVGSACAEELLASAPVKVSAAAEAFGLFWTERQGQKLLVAVGYDDAGLMYALLELFDRVRYAEDPIEALLSVPASSEKPANRIRSIKRVFSSEIEDKPWFYDRKFWEEYLTELAVSRLNRINLTLGMAIDNGHDPDLRDNYFCYPYPFFVQLDEYPDVRALYLSDEERQKNLETLRYISAQAKKRGIHFQLAIWTSAYKMVGCEHENYPILGINDKNHAAYTRDGLCALLRACPDIEGVTFRLHYESGIPEPAHEFWRVVFEGVKNCGRTIEMDLHAKGADFGFIDLALETGMPVVVSGKYHAEHFALPYHQTAIRPLEMPEAAGESHSERTVTTVTRRFTRYGYADYLRESRKYDFIYRIFPGTIRLLLWGDPTLAAGYGRYGSFCGSAGIEHMEPLTYKARKDSGFPGRRDAYQQESLRLPENGEWKKYLYFYRIWGRHLYNPDCDPQVWRRYLSHEFGKAALECEYALSYASRVLPLITFSHLPSAAHNGFWAEMYTNMPILEESAPAPYGDTPDPKIFSTVSPLDPGMFYSIEEFADAVMAGSRTGRLSPLEVAAKLDELADQAKDHLSASRSQIAEPEKPSYRRWYIDTAVQLQIGRFFARKFRAATAYSLYSRTQNKELLEEAIAQYRRAIAAWEEIVKLTKDVYRPDITFGFVPSMRGSWADRLAAMEEDILNMEKKRGEPNQGAPLTPAQSAVLHSVKGDDREFCHTPPCSFTRGRPLEIVLEDVGSKAQETLLHYRHVNQSEKYVVIPMKAEGKRLAAQIPAAFTDTDYPILYFFEERGEDGNAWYLPGISKTMDNQPYYVVREKK